MLDDREQPSGSIEEDVLGGDLELDPQDAEQVTGGARFVCPGCHHSHSQADPPCNVYCKHGTGSGGVGFY
jgi:hypothetical protein